MADPRLIDVTLDDSTILIRSPEIQEERRIAIIDLLAHNHFQPCRAAAEEDGGPYRLHLSVREGRLALEIAREDGAAMESHVLGLARFRRPIRDYFAICDSYFEAVRKGAPQQIETIDMARRGVHNDAAELLRECLDGKIAVDFDTARRLFTLICVLHMGKAR